MGPVFEEGGLVLGFSGTVEMEVVDDAGVAVEDFGARDDVTLPFCTKRPLWASQHAAVCLSSASQQKLPSAQSLSATALSAKSKPWRSTNKHTMCQQSTRSYEEPWP